ncbi:hypothetical protein [Gimesia chilikensis]|uniref:hypothetical protein n=1 Tax=Gimesia chilikensis TaxID=2605989 RepID=UPI001F54B95E|nr:hypothetical protein [Gimesia chilikensis]
MSVNPRANVEASSSIPRLDSIQIDAEFRDLCPALSFEESTQLRDNILSDGEFREPLIVWKSQGILVDGHNRFHVWRNLTDEQRQRIAAPRIRQQEFSDRDAVHDWIINNQIGRRNVAPSQRAYLVGKLYNSQKKNDKDFLKRGDSPPSLPGDQIEHPGKTAGRIADRVGMSPAQIRRDAKYAEAVDKLAANLGPSVRDELLNAKKISKDRAVEIAALPADQQKAEYERAMGRGEPSGGTSFTPYEWGGMEPTDEPVVPHGVVTEYHVKEMQTPFNEVQKQATALKKAIQELPNGPGGAWCGPNAMNDIMTCYTNLINTINHRKPVVVCGHCNGQKCDKCYQTGALNKDLSQLFIEGQNATQGTTGSVRQAV